MYQVRAQCGNDIQVLDRGAEGRCRVVGPNGEIKYTGTYDQCVAWLHARGVLLLEELDK